MSLTFLACAAASAAPLPDKEDSKAVTADILSIGAEIAKSQKLDPVLSKWLLYDPSPLLGAQERYAVLDLEDSTDTGTVSVSVADGMVLLRDPAATGEFVRFRYRDEDGAWVRHPDGRYLVTNWYRTPDGRLSKIIRNEDGDGVGTYTVDPARGGYELNLDLDADRVVDLNDTITGDGHEQLMVTALGLDWIDVFLSGQNPLCYVSAIGGTPGMAEFGSGADSRAVMSGCSLSRGSAAGGYAGSFGNPAGGDLLGALCDELAGDPDPGAALRERIQRTAWADDCHSTCESRRNACILTCASDLPTPGGPSGPVDGCVHACQVEAVECHADCQAEVESAGTTEDVPPPPVDVPETPASESRFHDEDGDGVPDAEDTDGDGVVDSSCASAGCTAEAYPPVNDGVVPGDWSAFCRETPSGRSRLNELVASAMDCPGLDEGASYDTVDAWFASCFFPPGEEGMDVVTGDLGSTSCAEPRGCEPDIRARVRASFAARNDATFTAWLDCGDDLLCQPVPL